MVTYETVFQEARKQYQQYLNNPPATQECRAEDNFDFWIYKVTLQLAKD